MWNQMYFWFTDIYDYMIILQEVIKQETTTQEATTQEA